MSTGKIAILAAIRDCYEPYIRFWVDYHLGIGATHVFIYDNESLEPIPDYGDQVTVTRWPGPHGQLAAYKHGLDVVRAGGFEWVALIDDDEFIVIPERTLPEFLDGFPDAPGVCLNWRNFGSSGWKVPPPNGDVFAAFNKCFPKAASVHKHVKTISRVAEAVSLHNPHFCVCKDGQLPVNELGTPVKGPFSEPPSHVNAWVNHYYVRSLADYEAKGRRGRGAIEGFPYDMAVLKSTDRQSTELYTQGRGRSAKRADVAAMDWAVAALDSAVAALDSVVAAVHSGVTAGDPGIAALDSAVAAVHSAVTAVHSGVTAGDSAVAAVHSAVATVNPGDCTQAPSPPGVNHPSSSAASPAKARKIELPTGGQPET